VACTLQLMLRVVTLLDAGAYGGLVDERFHMPLWWMGLWWWRVRRGGRLV
jgi:hypothetical protein